MTRHWLAFLIVLPAAAQVSFAPHPFRNQPAASVVTADFNGDGHADIAALEPSANARSTGNIYLGNGDGTFEKALAFGSTPADLLAAGDFNGDGHPDVAIGVFSTSTITIYLGKNDGTFQPAAPFTVASVTSLTAMCAGDWNGDHKTDLALLDRSSSTLVVLTSHGDGTFSTTEQHAIQHNSVNFCAVADFNGDGKSDIGVVSGILLGPSSEGFLSVFLGKGDGSFQSVPSMAVASGAGTFVSGDFNRDGKTDVAVTGFGSFPMFNSLVQVFSGAGDGTFTLAFSTPDPFTSIGFSYGALNTADFSGDGRLDLISSNSLGFLAGNGDGTFENLVVAAQGTSGGPAVADFNEDGKPDVATFDSVYLNTTRPVGAHVKAGGLVNAASFQTPALSPGSLISIFGSGLTLTQMVAPAGNLNLTLSGTQIELDTIPVPLLFVSPLQVNAQVPWELAVGEDATFDISVSGVPGQTFKAPAVMYSPGIFTLDAAGQGAVIVAAPGTVIAAPAGAFPGSRPVNRGEYIQIFGTGLGPVSHQPATGEPSPFSPLAETASQPSLDLGGISLTPSFSGLMPGTIGVYQVNVLVPQSAPTGDSVQLMLTIGGVQSNTVRIAVN